MSYDQWLGEIGAVVTPDITKYMFLQVIRQINHAFDLYTRKNVADCDCIQNTYKTPDPDCDLCGGTGSTGGFDEQPAYSFLGSFQPRSENNQDQHQRLYSKAGPIDTLDGVIYTEDKWYDVIHLDDVIIWRQKGEPKGYELRVISKVPNLGFNNEMIYIRIDVTKNPYPIRKDDIADYKGHI